MNFKLNQHVTLKTLKRSGQIVSVLKNDWYMVALGAVKMKCKGSDLEVSNEIIQERGETQVTASSSVRFNPALDLHGLTSEEALMKVDALINQAVISKISKLEIMHGLGTGKLKTVVHQYLASCTMVSAYKVNPLNPGVTWVFL